MSAKQTTTARLLSSTAPLAVLVLVFLAAWLTTPNFAEITLREGRFFGAVIDILQNGSIVCLLAIGMTLVIAAGFIDLSVGSVMALSGAAAALVLTSPLQSAPLAICAGLAVGAACGVVNGALVRFIGLPPIIATLVWLIACRGIAQTITDDQKVRFVSPKFEHLANGSLFGLPLPLLLVALIGASAVFLVRRCTAGLQIRGLGASPTAAAYCAVPVTRITLTVFGICGACAGLAGMIAAADIKEADVATCGQYLELDAILAVVLGGTPLRGGRANIIGSLLGALSMQTISTTMQMRGVPAEHTLLIKGAFIIVATLVQSPALRPRLARIFLRRAA